MSKSGLVFIIMGVASTGKSTVGSELSRRIGAKFIDGDDLHPRSNVIKMSNGQPLDDHDRAPWLIRIRDAAFSIEKKSEVAVIVCSALKKSYRDAIREGNEHVVFLHLHADQAIVAQRMQNREGHFMPPSLLDSQYQTLEMPTHQEINTHYIDINCSFEQVVQRCIMVSEEYLTC
ncbi:gluconokinase [Vibrio sp. S4M6]|uniref:gluconokinase n=1 Tax=Vibrio sinus TaxID=2946865 RepID=UPI00202A6EA5|nr:gluconokinase [Vibrio sinus]MCL9781643.1 gluconokinase [Vibrio sinus]